MLTELRALETEKLKEMLFKLKIKLVEYRFQLSQGALRNTSLIGITKRTIAQLMTILTERKEQFSNKDLAHYIAIEEAKEKEMLKNTNK
ncbi:50S ribosomal protein L29 [Mycoplasma wenyonii str. Massachusetts]|uniref:Large ribosomal subunit protein uL29 n=1 Tax=Mycoplasma wenyonii (strain Massachusetts) TaxID=1197325 RepID=I6Z6C8_MYCWM|nr:50S ribosomal protein L29 [Mycoplasma wenyonii]AFN65138.1 50S ribosomal protein L29 [Mycoplasma wenyonii str. Massachusetts]